MPDRAERVTFVLQFLHLDDVWEVGQPLDHGVFHWLAKVFGKAHEFSRRQILIAEKQHLMSEPELTELLKHGDVIQRRAQIEPDDFRANGASYFLALNHGWGLPFDLRPKPRFDTTQVLALM